MPDHPSGKTITFRHAVAIYMASVLGGGILVLPGLAAQDSGPSSIIAWIILSVASYPFAFTFSRLALRNPQSGGIYSFSREAFGKYISNSVGWLFLAWVALGAPAIALAAGTYLTFAIPLSHDEIYGFAFIMVVSVGAVNYLGIRFSASLQLAIIVSIVALLIVSIVSASLTISLRNLSPITGNNGLYSVGTAMALVIWAFFGYENVPNLAGEFVNPKRDLHRSVTFSVIVIGILYTSLAVVTVGTKAYSYGGGLTPFSVILSSVFGPYGGTVAGIVAVVAIFSTMNAYMGGVSKLIQVLSTNGGIPKIFSVQNSRTGSASASISLLVLLSSLSLLLYWFIDASITTAFLTVSGIGVLTYIIGSGSGIRLLHLEGSMRTLPWISLLMSIAILAFIGEVILVAISVFIVSLIYSFLTIGRDKAPAAV